ncbi:hypothetical protein ACVWWK_007372 [Bradyrhizobium sp. LB9.1b]
MGAGPPGYALTAVLGLGAVKDRRGAYPDKHNLSVWTVHLSANPSGAFAK